MAQRFDIRSFLADANTHPVIDVRTPSEWEQARIPGAVNVPLFSDEERAEVGTTYNHEGRHEAILLGLDLVGPKMRSLVESAQEICELPGPLLVHCWRGGMRSGAMAWLLEFYGYEVRVLEGGYKAFRRFMLEQLEKELPKLNVLGGLTGAGKTDVLDELRERGEQVIDLEGLAHHYGSAFGGIGREQPSQAQFENELGLVMRELDGDRRAWIEDESRMVGKLRVPQTLWDEKQKSHLYFVDVPRKRRVDRLVAMYGDYSRDELADAFERISKRLGGERLKTALKALERDDLASACHEALDYYDRAYLHSLDKRDDETVTRLEVEPDSDVVSIADRLLATAR